MKNKKHSLIWKMESSEWSHTSYLIGTMHVKDAKAFVRMEDMMHCIRSCDIFATEFNLEEADASITAEGMDLPEDMTLETMLGEKKFSKIRKIIAKAFGLDIMFFKGSIPLLVSNLLVEKVLSDDMQSSLDQTLWAYAKGEDRIMMGIETFQEQMDILGMIPMDYQLKQLKEIAKHTQRFRQQILHTAQLFEEENIQQLYKSTKKSIGPIRKLMLYDRNVKMADRVEKIASEQSLCFAVGAGHLWGKKGLIKLLKTKGFILKPVPMNQN